MRRFWILFVIEAKAWRKDPISLVGGVFPALVLFVGFAALFAGRMTFTVAFIDHDRSEIAALLRQTLQEVESPFGKPYFELGQQASEDETWRAFREQRVDAVWVVPEGFGSKVAAGASPSFDMHFSNWSDDKAKNHRIYTAEIVWRLYEKLDYPAPPLSTLERYPRAEMVGWFSLIAVAIALLAAVLGGMFNMLLLTHKEHASGVTLEVGLAPRSVLLALLPKVLLALLVGLLTGSLFFVLLGWVEGVWPERGLGAMALLVGLTTLFWIGVALLMGLRVREYAVGGIATVLTGIVVFFVCGAMTPIRDAPDKSRWFMWLFPNGWAVDPLRDLVLFGAWPTNWTSAVAALTGFAAGGLVLSLAVASRRLRVLG